MTVDLLNAALAYAKRGWAVFPLKPGTKVPATIDGFKSATKDEGIIRAWWEREPTYGIGLATGQVSNLVVLDFDKKTNGLDTYATMGPSLTATTEVTTGGGGIHLYFSHPGTTIKNKAGLFPGTDVRGDGGYVVAPPTPGYALVEDRGQAALPHWLLKELTEKPQAPAPAVELPEGERGDLNKRTLRFIAKGCTPGKWHQEFYQAAMNLKQNGYTFEEAEEMLTKVTGHLDDKHDIPQLLDVYENREPIHPPAAPEPEGSTEGRDIAGEEGLNIAASSLVENMFAALADPTKVQGVQTGIAGLDLMLGGGKRLGELTVMMATAKTGKSSMYAYMIHQMLIRGQAVGYASREMRPDSEVLPNLLSIEFGESVLELAIDGKIDEERKFKYRQAVMKWPLYFASGYGPFPIESFREWVRELKARGVNWFFIDHLHYCVTEEDDWGQAVALVRELKTLTITENIHIDLIVQPTKVPDGVKLGLNSLKGGSGIGQAMDNLLLLEHTGTQHVRKLTLDRARFPLAEPGAIYLQYDKASRTFIQVEPEEPEQEAPPTAHKVLDFQRL
jgi:hypothetical protein